MTIDDLVLMAEHIHDAEGWNLGSTSTRDQRNAFWARVIGCAYHGHATYNQTPDRQWHLKKADATRPQTDDVATSLPSRNHWDCIPGAGADGYRFAATPHGPLPNDQIVYAPPVPDGASPTPEPPPSSSMPSYEELGGDEGAKKITRVLEHDYKAAGRTGLDGDCGGWLRRTDYDVLSGKIATVEESITVHRDEWLTALGLIQVSHGMMGNGYKCLICGDTVGVEKGKTIPPIPHASDCMTR